MMFSVAFWHEAGRYLDNDSADSQSRGFFSVLPVLLTPCLPDDVIASVECIRSTLATHLKWTRRRLTSG